MIYVHYPLSSPIQKINIKFMQKYTSMFEESVIRYFVLNPPKQKDTDANNFATKHQLFQQYQQQLYWKTILVPDNNNHCE